MGRKANSDYIEAARAVLGELGNGPIASQVLVTAAQERELVGTGKWVYHNFLAKVRASDEFDTSKRGYVTLVTDDVKQGQVEETPDIVEESAHAGTETLMDEPAAEPMVEEDPSMVAVA